MATPVTKPIASTIELITAANSLSERLQLLLSNDTQHVIKTNRDGLVLLHWSLIFEHHQGMLLLLRNGFPAPAFALMRPLEEAFLRLFVAMNGTDKQAGVLGLSRRASKRSNNAERIRPMAYRVKDHVCFAASTFFSTSLMSSGV